MNSGQRSSRWDDWLATCHANYTALYRAHHTGTINTFVCVLAQLPEPFRLLDVFSLSINYHSWTSQTPCRCSLNHPASLFWTWHTNPLAASISHHDAEPSDWDALHSHNENSMWGRTNFLFCIFFFIIYCHSRQRTRVMERVRGAKIEPLHS